MDAAAFQWTDQNWRGVALPHQVIYEMHIGTFTKQGTWSSALAELPHLAETGVTVLEVMPVAEFPGRFGWGYDGVQWFAPAHIYGSPDDFRSFVDRAHSLGMGVILDVVYNHLGPDGNYLGKFAPQYFCEETTPIGVRPSILTAPIQRAGARILHRERLLLDRRIPSGRTSAGCHAGHSRRFQGSYPARHGSRGPVNAPRRAR